MKIGITGTPGVGKTAVSLELAKYYKLSALNEKEFALSKGIGEFDAQENELVVPLPKLERALNKEKSGIFEGHLLCEIKADFDYLVLLRCHPELLETRLEARGYKAEKVQDNVFCEGIEYCKKHALRNYARGKIIEIESRKSIKETTNAIINELEKRKQK
ncbi:MAG: AAA family ATPase [archaeon]|nr:AAA family ATPase [archaeon]